MIENLPNSILLNPPLIPKTHERSGAPEKDWFWNTTFHDALEQIGATPDQSALTRRDAIAFTRTFNQAASIRAMVQINKNFLNAKGVDVEKAPKELALFNSYRARGTEIISKKILSIFLEKTLQRSAPIPEEQNVRSMQHLANIKLAEECRLKEIRNRALETIDDFTRTLRERGPLVMQGFFGSCYRGGAASEINVIGEYTIYQEGVYREKREPLDFLPQTVVVIGVRKRENQIFYIHPQDTNNKRIYVADFRDFTNSLWTLDGMPLFSQFLYQGGTIPEVTKKTVTLALYNPTFSSASQRQDAPILALNEESKVFWQLPVGKIGKDGLLTAREGEKKKATGFFYALQRIISTEAQRSPHGKICSIYRKEITFIQETAVSQEELYKKKTKADCKFLADKNVAMGPDLIMQAFKNLDDCHLLPQDNYEDFVLMAQMSNEQIMKMSEKDSEMLPLQTLGFDKLVDTTMAKGYGLTEGQSHELATMEAFMSTLRSKGPFALSGRYSELLYGDVQPTRYTLEIAGRRVYGWPKSTPYISKTEIVFKTIVVIGAEMKKTPDGQKQGFVYWIDPKDPSDPYKPELQRIFISSFATMRTHMFGNNGFPVSEEKPHQGVGWFS